MNLPGTSLDAVPLTYGQQGILLAKHRGRPGAATPYVRIELGPEADSEIRVREFLQLLVERVDALRAVLVRSRYGPSLIFRPPADAARDLGLVIGRPLDLQKLLSTSFGRGTPLCLAAVDDSDWRVVHLLVDHLAFDGWSPSLLADEAAKVWRFVAYGDALPPPPESLRSYMERQNTGDRAESDAYERFWRRAFQHNFTLELAERPADGWTQIVFPFPEPATDLLRQARQQFRTTDFTVVLAAFTTALLSVATSSQRSLLVYSPVADREPATSGTIGCLLNFIGIRINLGWSLAETIASTRDGLVGALAHQHGPFFKQVPKQGTGAVVTAQSYELPDRQPSVFPGTGTALPTSSSAGWDISDCAPRPIGDIWFAFARTRAGYSGEFAFANEFLDRDTARAVVRGLLGVLTAGISG